VSCRESSGPFYVSLHDIRLFEPWKISRDEFFNPSTHDKQRYDSLLELGFDKWVPVVLIKGGADDGGDLLFDGYHRYAIAKFLLKKDRILARY